MRRPSVNAPRRRPKRLAARGPNRPLGEVGAGGDRQLDAAAEARVDLEDDRRAVDDPALHVHGAAELAAPRRSAPPDRSAPGRGPCGPGRSRRIGSRAARAGRPTAAGPADRRRDRSCTPGPSRYSCTTGSGDVVEEEPQLLRRAHREGADAAPAPPRLDEQRRRQRRAHAPARASRWRPPGCRDVRGAPPSAACRGRSAPSRHAAPSPRRPPPRSGRPPRRWSPVRRRWSAPGCRRRAPAQTSSSAST